MTLLSLYFQIDIITLHKISAYINAQSSTNTSFTSSTKFVWLVGHIRERDRPSWYMKPACVCFVYVSLRPLCECNICPCSIYYHVFACVYGERMFTRRRKYIICTRPNTRGIAKTCTKKHLRALHTLSHWPHKYFTIIHSCCRLVHLFACVHVGNAEKALKTCMEYHQRLTDSSG